MVGTWHIWKNEGVFQKYNQEDDLFSTRFTSPDDAGYGTTPDKTAFSWSRSGCLWVYNKCFIPLKLIRWMVLLVSFYSVCSSRWHEILTFSHNPLCFQTNVYQTLFYLKLIIFSTIVSVYKCIQQKERTGASLFLNSHLEPDSHSHCWRV